MAELIHAYLAEWSFGYLHKAGFVLYFPKHFINLERVFWKVTWVEPWSFEKFHGLSHVKSHGLGHDIFKRVSWVEPGKISWVMPWSFWKGFSWVEPGEISWVRPWYIIFFEQNIFINFEDIREVIRGWQLWSLTKIIMGWQPWSLIKSSEVDSSEV